MGDKNKEEIDKIWKRIVKIEKDLYGKENPSEGKEIEIIGKIKEKQRKLEQDFSDMQEGNMSKLRSIENNYNERFSELENKYAALYEKLQGDLSVKSSELARLTREKEELRNKNTELQNEMDRLKIQIRELERQKEEADDKCEEFQKKINDRDEEIDKVKADLEDKTEEYDKVFLRLENKERELAEIKNVSKQQESEISDLNVKIEELEKKSTEERKVLTEEKEKLDEEIKELAEEKEKLRKELSNVSGSLHKRESELSDAKQRLDSTKQELNVYSRQFGNWEDVTRDYSDILSKLYKCRSLNGITEKYGLESDEENVYTVDNVLKFIGIVGVGDSFALEVYNTMRAYKKENDEYLNDEEKDFVQELNRYYKNVISNDFDVLYIPETENFERNIMQDMNNPTKLFRNISGVYVPGLNKDAKGIKQKAIVSGSR